MKKLMALVFGCSLVFSQLTVTDFSPKGFSWQRKPVGFELYYNDMAIQSYYGNTEQYSTDMWSLYYHQVLDDIFLSRYGKKFPVEDLDNFLRDCKIKETKMGMVSRRKNLTPL